MTDALSELRQAEATIIRMRDAAGVEGWRRPRYDEESSIIADGDGEDGPTTGTVAWCTRDEHADLIVLSVSVLVEAVLPIIQDALHHTWPLDDETHSKWIDDQHPAALRLARAINERTAS